MNSLTTRTIYCPNGAVKEISVINGNIEEVDFNIDLLTISSFINDYRIQFGGLLRSLYNLGISVDSLAKSPLIDLRSSHHIWASRKTSFPDIARVGCLEFREASSFLSNPSINNQNIITLFQSYFKMLELLELNEISLETIASPLLGTGLIKLDVRLILFPLLQECLAFLRHSRTCKRFVFIEQSAQKAKLIQDTITSSLLENEIVNPIILPPRNTNKSVFISYQTDDVYSANIVRDVLKTKFDINAWMAIDESQGIYSETIAKQIRNSDYFIVLLSAHSYDSWHVLSEINIAFNQLHNGLQIIPLQLDENELPPSFFYYLNPFQIYNATMSVFATTQMLVDKKIIHFN